MSSGEQNGAGVGFARVLWFPLPIKIPPEVPDTSVTLGCTVDPMEAGVTSGVSLTPLQS